MWCVVYGSWYPFPRVVVSDDLCPPPPFPFLFALSPRELSFFYYCLVCVPVCESSRDRAETARRAGRESALGRARKHLDLDVYVCRDRLSGGPGRAAGPRLIGLMCWLPYITSYFVCRVVVGVRATVRECEL